MATEVATLHIIVPVIVGFIIGIVEAYFVYEDENMTSGQQFFGDMWHGLVFSVIGVLAASNVPFMVAQGWIPSFLNSLLYIDVNNNSLVISAAITVFMFFKMVASHAIRGVSGTGFKEKLWHKLFVSIAIGFAPYYIIHIYPLFGGLQDVLPWLPL